MTSRRTFLKHSSILALSNVVDGPWSDLILKHRLKGSKVRIYATRWGYQKGLEDFCKEVKQVGYDGIEIWVPKGEDLMRLSELLSEHHLRLGLLAGNWGKTYEQHMLSFKESLDEALSLKPDFVNCHAGKDYFSLAQNLVFIRYGQKRAQETGIPVYHETHRGRMLYSIPNSLALSKAAPDLEITLDISHWCCVHESLLADQSETLKQLFPRVRHIHARVGFAEGPQVPDPTSPHFQKATDIHLQWWDDIIDKRTEDGQFTSITTEFGPAGYMWIDPDSGKPLRNNWEVNQSMFRMLEKRYK